jgi:hypothetical protein
VEIVLHLAKYGLMKLVPIYMFSVGAGTKTWKAWQGGVNLHCFFFSTHHFFVWNRVVWEWSNNKTMQSHTILRLAWYPLQCGNCFAPSQIWFNEIGTNLHVFSGGRYQNMNRLTRWCQFALFFFFNTPFFCVKPRCLRMIKWQNNTKSHHVTTCLVHTPWVQRLLFRVDWSQSMFTHSLYIDRSVLSHQGRTNRTWSIFAFIKGDHTQTNLFCTET